MDIDDEHVSVKERCSIFCKLYWKTIVIMFFPLLLSPYILHYHGKDYNCLYVIMLMCILWITESLPLPITSLLPVILFPPLGVLQSTRVTLCYMRETIVTMVCSIIFIVTVVHSKVHKRIALKLVRLFGFTHRRLSFAFAVTTMFISMWIPNPAAVSIMLPLIERVLAVLHEEGVAKIYLTEYRPSVKMLNHYLRPSKYPGLSRYSRHSFTSWKSGRHSTARSVRSSIGSLGSITETPKQRVYPEFRSISQDTNFNADQPEMSKPTIKSISKLADDEEHPQSSNNEAVDKSFREEKQIDHAVKATQRISGESEALPIKSIIKDRRASESLEDVTKLDSSVRSAWKDSEDTEKTVKFVEDIPSGSEDTLVQKAQENKAPAAKEPVDSSASAEKLIEAKLFGNDAKYSDLPSDSIQLSNEERPSLDSESSYDSRRSSTDSNDFDPQILFLSRQSVYDYDSKIPNLVKAEETSHSDIAMCYYLLVAYSSTIGGMGTLVGTGGNMAYKGLYESLYPMGPTIEFPSFMIHSTLPMIIIELIMYLYFQVYFMGLFRPKSKAAKRCRMNAEGQRLMKEAIDAQHDELGPISVQEKIGVLIFILGVLLFITRDPKYFPGWSILMKSTGYSANSAFVVLIIFSVPSKFDFLKFFKKSVGKRDLPRKPSSRLLSWKSIHLEVPWGLIFLLGAGFAIAEAWNTSGADSLMRSYLKGAEKIPQSVLTLVVMLICKAIAEFSSSIAIINVMLPVLKELSSVTRIHPTILMVAGSFGSSFVFHLPSSCPTNGIVANFGQISSKTMALAAIGPSIIVAIMIWLMLQYWTPIIYPAVVSFPHWAELENIKKLTV